LADLRPIYRAANKSSKRADSAIWSPAGNLNV